MAKVAFVCGIAGGVLTIAAGVGFLVTVLSSQRISANWFLIAVLVFITSIGITSLSAMAIRVRNPRAALARIQASIISLFLVMILDPGVFPVFILPAAVLLIPEAIYLSRYIHKVENS